MPCTAGITDRSRNCLQKKPLETFVSASFIHTGCDLWHLLVNVDELFQKEQEAKVKEKSRPISVSTHKLD